MDHVEQAKSRVIQQYRNAPKFLEWIASCPKIANEQLESVLLELINSYDVDRVTGEQLDVIGRVVGIVRPIVKYSDYKVFGYYGNDSYVNYGVAPYIGKNDQQETLISDEFFRILVKAKIAKNISDATLDSIIQLAQFVTGTQVYNIDDPEDFTFRLNFVEELSYQVQFLLLNFDIIPRPQGVTMLDYAITPINIADIERASNAIFNYANFTLPGDVT